MIDMAISPPHIAIEIQVNNEHDTDWTLIGPAVRPGDPHGSGTVILDDHLTTVVFGWSDGNPYVWEKAGTLRQLADLRDGPVELPGPLVRWRFTLEDGSE
jgi:hypothetical protein